MPVHTRSTSLLCVVRVRARAILSHPAPPAPHTVRRACRDNMLSFMVTATPSLTIPDCAADFVAAQLNFRNFDKYDTWFDDNSTLTLAQTGVYSGVDDILEYSYATSGSNPRTSRHQAGLLLTRAPWAGNSSSPAHRTSRLTACSARKIAS